MRGEHQLILLMIVWHSLVPWNLFILCGCQWPLDLNVTELTTWIWLNDMSLSLLNINKYGGFVYLTSTSCYYGHKTLFYITWYLFILCGCKWHLNLNSDKLNHLILFTRYLLYIVRKQIWWLCVPKLNNVMVTGQMFVLCLLTYLLTCLLTYLLTYSMEQSRSWKAKRFSANQVIPRILWSPKFITAFTRARQMSLSWASSIQSMPQHSNT
jgi:hypothetical protein